MAKIDLRVRLLGKALRASKATSITKKKPADILRYQQKDLTHNMLSDAIVGGVTTGVTLRDTTVAGAVVPIGARVYRPSAASSALPLIVFIHGGGWTTGSLNTHDWLASNIASGINAVVVSLDYRLAPTHPWPAATEDCYAALCDSVARAAEWDADPTRVALVGDSAGGNLAAVMTLMARDRCGPAIDFQVLIYPSTDLTYCDGSVERYADAPVLSKQELFTYRDIYLQGQDPRDPYVSPLLARDHRGLPPALIQVAEHDPICDEGLRYAQALKAAHIPVRTTMYYGMPHGFLAFPRICRSAPQALGEICSELGAALSTPTSSRRN